MSNEANEAAIGRAYARLFDGLDRLGPGSTATRRAVLALLRPHLPARPRVADMGCGAGAGTRDLAADLPAAAITAIDTHAGFLAALRRRVGPSVLVLDADMAAPSIPAGSLDLVWCESAIYSVGRIVALTAWRPLLAPGGLVAFSDVVWTTDDPPAAARAFWDAEYPAMTTPAAIEAEISAAGYRAMARYAAPRRDWLDYYAPLRERLDRLAAGADATLAAILEGMRREIAVFDDHADSYASVWFVLRVDG